MQGIEVVRPTVAALTLDAMSLEGMEGISAARFVGAYRESVEGNPTSAVLELRDFV